MNDRRTSVSGLGASQRICIIGAGPAGLSAAYYLEKRGYRDVTVLERETRVGGMCRSVECDGRSVDTGAIIVTEAYSNFRGIAEDLGACDLYTLEPSLAYDAHSYKQMTMPEALLAGHSRLDYARAVARYLWLRGKHHVERPGFRHMSTSMASSFADWTASPTLEPLRPLFELAVLGMGYGPYNDVAAAYVLKYLGRSNIWATLRPSLGGRPGASGVVRGYQSVWEELSRHVHVRLGVQIAKVDRSDGVRVTLADGSQPLSYDRLIVTSPLDRSLDFLDGSDAESELFSQIRYNDYHVAVVRTKGLPNRRLTPFNSERSHRVGGVTITVTHPPSDLRVLYMRGGGRVENVDRDSALDAARSEIDHLGGAITDVIDYVRWPYYFPHVSAEAMLGGFYDRLEALQGHRNTFYANGLMNFGDVEHTVQYSRDLVERHF